MLCNKESSFSNLSGKHKWVHSEIIWKCSAVTNCCILLKKHVFLFVILIFRLGCINDLNSGSNKIMYRQTSNIGRTLMGNKLVDHSNVVGASPVGLLQLHLHSQLNTCFNELGKDNYKTRRETFKFWDLVSLILEVRLQLMYEIQAMAFTDFSFISDWLNTLRPRQKADVFHTTFSAAFSWMKMFQIWIQFDWSSFLKIQMTIIQHWFR